MSKFTSLQLNNTAAGIEAIASNLPIADTQEKYTKAALIAAQILKSNGKNIKAKGAVQRNIYNRLAETVLKNVYSATPIEDSNPSYTHADVNSNAKNTAPQKSLMDQKLDDCYKKVSAKDPSLSDDQISRVCGQVVQKSAQFPPQQPTQQSQQPDQSDKSVSYKNVHECVGHLTSKNVSLSQAQKHCTAMFSNTDDEDALDKGVDEDTEDNGPAAKSSQLKSDGRRGYIQSASLEEDKTQEILASYFERGYYHKPTEQPKIKGASIKDNPAWDSIITSEFGIMKNNHALQNHAEKKTERKLKSASSSTGKPAWLTCNESFMNRKIG